MFLFFFFFFLSLTGQKKFGGTSRSPPFLGGRPGVPLSRGDVQESPFWGVSSPTLGSRVPPSPPASPQKGDVGKRPPWSPPVPGTWGTRPLRPPPWGTRPRGTLALTTKFKLLMYILDSSSWYSTWYIVIAVRRRKILIRKTVKPCKLPSL
jgi:hypothetical protein